MNVQPIPGNVGGPAYKYTITMSEAPLVPLDVGAFPVAYGGGNDGRVRISRAAQPSDRIAQADFVDRLTGHIVVVIIGRDGSCVNRRRANYRNRITVQRGRCRRFRSIEGIVNRRCRNRAGQANL